MIMTLYNLCAGKNRIVEENIENERFYYIDRIYEITKNAMLLPFFELSVENTAIDARQYFVELECENNFFYDNLAVIDKERGRRLYKIMTAHNLIKLLVKKRRKLNPDALKQELFKVFEYNESEKKLFDILYKCAIEYEAKFSSIFALTVAKYIFDRDRISVFSLAFIENFCYNAYSSFMQTFTKYASLSSRIKKAAN